MRSGSKKMQAELCEVSYTFLGTVKWNNRMLQDARGDLENDITGDKELIW